MEGGPQGMLEEEETLIIQVVVVVGMVVLVDREEHPVVVIVQIIRIKVVEVVQGLLQVHPHLHVCLWEEGEVQVK